MNDDGSLKDEGFISTGTYTQYLVVDETHGYYLDADRSTLNLQKFNPSTMAGTGEVDLTSLAKTEVDGITVERQVIGQHTLAAKEGTQFEVEIRGKRVRARVVKRRFYKEGSHL